MFVNFCPQFRLRGAFLPIPKGPSFLDSMHAVRRLGRKELKNILPLSIRSRVSSFVARLPPLLAAACLCGLDKPQQSVAQAH